MDAEIERIATAMRLASLWDDTLFVFAADNGGPPCKPQRSARSLFALCSWRFAQEVSRTLVAELLALCPPDVANSNYPMRGGKWTIWCVPFSDLPAIDAQRSATALMPHQSRLSFTQLLYPSGLTSQCCCAVECRQGGRYPPDRVCPRRRPACQGLHRAHASLRLGGHHCGRRGRRQAAAGWRAQARLVSLTTLDALCSTVAGQAGMLSATKSVRPQAEHVGDTDGQINRQRRP